MWHLPVQSCVLGWIRFSFPLDAEQCYIEGLVGGKSFFYIFKCIGKQDSIVIGNHTNVGRGRGSGYVAADTEPAGVGNNDKNVVAVERLRYLGNACHARHLPDYKVAHSICLREWHFADTHYAVGADC